MPQRYVYDHAIGSNVDVSARVRAYRTSLKSNAEEGSVALSTVIIDDPDGGLGIKGHRGFTLYEGSESSNSQLVYRGYTAGSDITRGPFRNASARIWTVQMSDQNSLINRRIMLGSDANRPAETDVQRVQWLMTTVELGGIVSDSSLINTTGGVAMDAADYRNQRCQDILDDCSQASGKNFFIWINDSAGGVGTNGLFYDFAGSTAYSSAIRLTNVLADVDNPVTASSSTFAVIDDETSLNRDPSRVYSGIVLPFDGGQVYQQSYAIGQEFFNRDTTAPSVNVKTPAKATARAIRYLADAATEADVIKTAFLVPLEKVNRLKEGMTFQAKFSHLPGYTDWTWLRCLNRTVIATSEEFYTIQLEASPAASSAAPVLACAALVSAMTVWDSGALGTIGGTNGPPISVSPGSPSAYPAVVIGGVFGHQGTTEMAHTGTPTVTGFTELLAAPSGATASVAGAGYKALTSGSPGAFDLNFLLGAGAAGAERWRGLTIAVRTAATSPVQSGAQLGSGGTITLGATPTVGNILVLVRFVETSAFAAVPSGYTQIGVGSFATSSPGLFYIDICVRCVQTGDTALQTLQDTSFSHWQTLSEWALT